MTVLAHSTMLRLSLTASSLLLRSRHFLSQPRSERVTAGKCHFDCTFLPSLLNAITALVRVDPVDGVGSILKINCIAVVCRNTTTDTVISITSIYGHGRAPVRM